RRQRRRIPGTAAGTARLPWPVHAIGDRPCHGPRSPVHRGVRPHHPAVDRLDNLHCWCIVRGQGTGDHWGRGGAPQRGLPGDGRVFDRVVGERRGDHGGFRGVSTGEERGAEGGG